jgi:hypothetical protein
MVLPVPVDTEAALPVVAAVGVARREAVAIEAELLMVYILAAHFCLRLLSPLFFFLLLLPAPRPSPPLILFLFLRATDGTTLLL